MFPPNTLGMGGQLRPEMAIAHYRRIAGATDLPVIADLQVALFRAVKAGDLKSAQAINDRIVPLSQVVYAPPFVDMHNRMKEAVVLLGRLDKAVVQPPLVKITDAEIARIGQALRQAGIAREGALKLAA